MKSNKLQVVCRAAVLPVALCIASLSASACQWYQDSDGSFHYCCGGRHGVCIATALKPAQLPAACQRVKLGSVSFVQPKVAPVLVAPLHPPPGLNRLPAPPVPPMEGLE